MREIKAPGGVRVYVVGDQVAIKKPRATGKPGAHDWEWDLSVAQFRLIERQIVHGRGNADLDAVIQDLQDAATAPLRARLVEATGIIDSACKNIEAVVEAAGCPKGANLPEFVHALREERDAAYAKLAEAQQPPPAQGEQGPRERDPADQASGDVARATEPTSGVGGEPPGPPNPPKRPARRVA